MHAPPITPPALADVRHGETVVDVHSRPDTRGRVTLTAYWRDTNIGRGCNQTGVRGQVFWTTLAEFTANSQEHGRSVRIRYQPEQVTAS